MTAVVVLMMVVGVSLLPMGIITFAFARTGPQETLGGLMVTVGMVATAVAGVIWKLAF